MKYDVKILSNMAIEMGANRNTLEKVLRLSEILRFINTNDVLKGALALKGGTAINILYDELPRLSVDIDLDYALHDDKETMIKQRTLIKGVLESYFTSEGYVLNKHSRYSYSLDAFVISYSPSGGGSDNIKVEINYSMRGHLLPLEYRPFMSRVVDSPFLVLTVSKIELYAGKINALLSRSQIRDLYDTYRMIQKGLIETHEYALFKNIVLFYRYIQNDSLEDDPSWIQRHNQRTYVRDLLPVLRRGDLFNLDIAKAVVLEFITRVTTYEERQLKFIESSIQHQPQFEYLFDDESIVRLAYHHPMTLWKKETKI